MSLKKGIEKASNVVVASIQAASTEVSGKEQVSQVASISASDEEIGDLIAEVMEKVGKDGVITVEESKGIRYETEFVEGMQFDRGYISPYFVTNSERMEAVLDDPVVIVTDQKVTAISDMLPLLQKAMEVSKNVVLVAEDVEGEALATLVVNKIRGTINCLAVKAPGFGDRRKAMLQDVAVLTGAQVISEEVGTKLETAGPEVLGRCRRVVATKDDTTVVEGRGDEAEIQARINQIKAQIEDSSSDFDREKLQERMAKLSGGVAIIKVGAATEVELKEKKHRVEDALSATRAAVEEGIVPGGGVALVNAIPSLDSLSLELEGDEATGVRIVRRALEEPLRMIAINAGREGSVVVDAVKTSGKLGWGYDAGKDEYGEMVERGIIDPAKVTRAGLENAASIAGIVLTTESLITDIPEEGPPAMAPPPMDY